MEYNESDAVAGRLGGLNRSRSSGNPGCAESEVETDENENKNKNE
jgi:hypothetical protein